MTGKRNRPVVLAYRCTPEEAAMVRAAARVRGLSVAEYSRQVVTAIAAVTVVQAAIRPVLGASDGE